MSETNQMSQGNARPTFLTVLCILSFIAAGIGIISMLLVGAARGVVDAAGVNVQETMNTEMANSGMSSAETEAMNTAMDQATTAFSWPYIITAMVLILVGLYGVIKMWKLQKQGYYIYAGTQVAGIIVPLIFGMAFSTFGAVLAVAFIALYGMNLKHMS